MGLISRIFRPKVTVAHYTRPKAIDHQKQVQAKAEQLRRECGLPVDDLPWRRAHG